MSIKMIVATNKDYGIGYKNELLFHVSEDLKRFRDLTTGHFVVMGRKTYESIPKPLPKRINVVLTRDKDYSPKNKETIVEHDPMKIINHYLNTGKQTKDLWIIGGNEIYELFLPFVDEIYLTYINKSSDKVDTYFPCEQLNKFKELYKLFSYVNIDGDETEVQYIKYIREGM